MKRRHLSGLVWTAFALLLFVGLAYGAVTDRYSVFATPFVLVGRGLRRLSLSGEAGNVVAVALYAVLSLLPLLLNIKRKWLIEDVLPVVCSLLMFFVLYYMINPSLRPTMLSGEIGDVILSFSIYSVLLSWGIVKLMRSYDSFGAANVFGALRMLLVLCIGVFLVLAAAESRECFGKLCRVAESNALQGASLIPTFLVIGGSCLVALVEYGFDILTMLLAVKLLKELEADPYSQAACAAAGKVSSWCKRTLLVICLSGTALNLVQILLAPVLYDLHVTLRIPVLSIAVVFALMLLTRLLNQGKQIKEDNDLFI